MDTLLILRDTITVDVVKIISTYSPCTQEVETNWADVEIVSIICIAVVLTVFIVSLLFILWYYFKKQAERKRADWDIWITLKKEYRKMALTYIKEKGDNLKEKDSYLEQLGRYILQIDEHLKLYSSKKQKKEKVEDNECV